MYTHQYRDVGLGFFGSKKRKRTEQKVAQTTQVTQQNSALVTQVNNQFRQTIPQLQNQLAQAQQELQRQANRTQGKTNNIMGYAALGIAVIGTSISLYNKFSS